ncbi:MAG: glycosyltransferase family 2 protein [Dongiaceae bacterium]
MSPLVSVIVPAWRAEATLARAVRSLLAQTLAGWEAIIVADDDVDYRALLAAQGIADDRLRFVRSRAPGSGAAAARNAGLAAAAGRLLTPLDADDLFDAARLARLAPLAEQAGAVFDNVRVVEEETGALLRTAFPVGGGEQRIEAAAVLQGSAPLKPLLRRELTEGWDEALRLCDDVVFNLRLLDRTGPAPLVAEPLQEYRVREGSICHAPDSGARAERDYGWILQRLAADGYGIADPALRRLARDAFAAKRDLNRAFEAARQAGRATTFQAFVAAGGAG